MYEGWDPDEERCAADGDELDELGDAFDEIDDSSGSSDEAEPQKAPAPHHRRRRR